MAVNIRLTPEIDSLARSYCQRVGISLNSLVGVALDAYLQHASKNTGSAEPTVAEPVIAKPAAPVTPAFVGKPERPTLTAPVFNVDPKPVLPAKPSKADRAKLAQWHLRHQAK